MYAVKGIYQDETFKPMQPIPVNEDYEVIITFVQPVVKIEPDDAKPKKHRRSEFIGKWKGQIWMSDDFDEPLEEMKEYME